MPPTRTLEAPRDDLIRAVFRPQILRAGAAARMADNAGNVSPLRLVRADDVDADVGEGEARDVMVGYPIVFDSWAEIDSWEGRFLERVAAGAVRKTLADRGDRVKVQFDHGFDPSIGDKPLGRASVMEPDESGLWTEVPLSRTSYNADLAELIRDGAIDGMSFRFSVVREDWDMEPEASDDNPDGLPERTISELRLFEFGPVTWPAYEATTVWIRSRQAFAAWQRLSPDERAGILAGRLTGEPDAARQGTSDAADDAPPSGHPSRLTAGERARALRELRMEAARCSS